MTGNPEVVESIRAWLANELGVEVDAGHIFDREVWLFKGYTDGGGTAELEVTKEALEDLPLATIVADLKAKRLPVLMLENPTIRYRYLRSRGVSEHDR